MNVTLQVNGREMTFSKEELSSILEEYFESKEDKVNQQTTEIAQVPTEGKWFQVNPLDIDQSLFKTKRTDLYQNQIRTYILDAFEEMKLDSRYRKPFKTMIPKKEWSTKSVRELLELSSEFGDKTANWVEQALEWAQRIANGESWEDICNKSETNSNWYRLVLWTDQPRLVGGSIRSNTYPAARISPVYYLKGHVLKNTVPLVVSYD